MGFSAAYVFILTATSFHRILCFVPSSGWLHHMSLEQQGTGASLGPLALHYRACMSALPGCVGSLLTWRLVLATLQRSCDIVGACHASGGFVVREACASVGECQPEMLQIWTGNVWSTAGVRVTIRQRRLAYQ